VRLSDRIVHIIKHAVRNSFGDVNVYLFGSRVDDNKRGGDIDIAVDVNVSKMDFRKMKIEFLKCLIKADMDIKIDVVEFNNNDNLLNSEIHLSCVKL
jgi:predicted nucleotidyltransferase